MHRQSNHHVAPQLGLLIQTEIIQRSTAMFNRRNFSVLCLAGFLLGTTTYGREAPSPILISDERGQCYVKSVPPNRHGQSRGTRVYRLETEKDQLLHSFDWYSSDLDIACGYFDSRRRGRRDRFSASLVRMGRGWKGELGKTSAAVTLAFYLDGKVLAEYSRMDIAFLPGNRKFDPAGSWRGYWRPLGYSRSGSSSGFEICTIGGRILLFDFTSGELIRQARDHSDRCEPMSPQRSPDFQKIVSTYY